MQKRYQQDYDAGQVGNEVYSRSGRNLPPHRPRRIFDREEVAALRRHGLSYRSIARKLGLGLGDRVSIFKTGPMAEHVEVTILSVDRGDRSDTSSLSASCVSRPTSPFRLVPGRSVEVEFCEVLERLEAHVDATPDSVWAGRLPNAHTAALSKATARGRFQLGCCVHSSGPNNSARPPADTRLSVLRASRQRGGWAPYLISYASVLSSAMKRQNSAL
jgi:hypothetical protein